ncbi:MAG: hypothetical protein JNL08_03725 [Planctomycetes bacterium]|nr:hypothetical protein [Planctomycetota bacterium]
MLPYRLRWLFGLVSPLLLPGAAAYGLTRLLPLPWAVPAFLVAVAAVALVGCLVLRSTAVQQITWRNRVAGRCLPFAQCMGGGTLFQVYWSSVLGSTAVGGFVFLFVYLHQRAALPPWPLAVAWGIDALTLLFLATTQTRLYRHSAPTARRGRWFYLAVVLQIVVSTALHLAGHPWAATVVAAGPQIALLTPMALYMLAVLTAGSKARWR